MLMGQLNLQVLMLLSMVQTIMLIGIKVLVISNAMIVQNLCVVMAKILRYIALERWVILNLIMMTLEYNQEE